MRARLSSSPLRSIAIVVALLTAAFAAIFIAAPTASATTYVKGLIVTNTVWGPSASPPDYVVTQDLTIVGPATLTIQAGTSVRFDVGAHLFVSTNAALWANGTSAKLISFAANNTIAVGPWGGIQFNASSRGSVSWSTFDRPDRAITVLDSSPFIDSNTIIQANVGFAFIRSSSVLSNNLIRRAANLGVYVNASSVQVLSNRINGTGIGIQVEQAGTPMISGNTITNVSSGFAVGILVTMGATAFVHSNTIRSVQGARGPNGVGPGAAGRDGAIAFGIYIDLGPSATVSANTVDTVSGGRGGDGQPNPGGAGGRGGNGGSAAGIVVARAADPLVSGNTVTAISGGRGGPGGGSGPTTTGGRGGDAGSAVGIELAFTTGFAQVPLNDISALSGGVGGNGGDAVTDGNGGVGGDAHGIFLISVANPDTNRNSVKMIRGGLGGNSTLTGLGATVNGDGAAGGTVMGIAIFSVIGTASVWANMIVIPTGGTALAGGDGGRGSRGGRGGNATAVVLFGNNDGRFNATFTDSNWIQEVTGGAGGTGTRFGGNGGTAVGIVAIYVTPSLSWNGVYTLQGGRGGDAIDLSDGGRGGDADGMVGGLVANGLSVSDTISGVTKGAVGSGPPARVSYANGFYLIGNGTFRTRFTVENATLTGIGTYEFNVDNYTNAVSLNTPFTKFMVRSAGNLTVRNYLEIDALWPNGLTPVTGANFLVEDNAVRVWQGISSTGVQRWIKVTDRVYINSNTPTDNVTRVTVTYGTYSFANDPRLVNMNASHTEAFVMVDKAAPTSAASPLPRYENSRSFSVGYTASDGNGTGIANVTLWYRGPAGGGWVKFVTQPGGNFGFFWFTAATDGVYEFATTAQDVAGNTQPGPFTNNTWTIVDTVRPGSHVNMLPTYETSKSFSVSWAPDPGVTDIAMYTIQYNAGPGWIDWLVDTTATSGTFTAGPDGAYAFRSIAKDGAGNVEIPPATNDTWTIVDTSPPWSHTLPLPTYETSVSFQVSWGPQFDTLDIASYRIQAKDNAGPWTDWILATTASSSSYSGTDGHTYQFRSIATDRAGNVEPLPSGNDSWTIVDATRPDSVMTALPTYENVLSFTIAWGPASGTTDIVSYSIQSKDGSAAWADVPGATNTTARSTVFAGQDGHVYAFRTIARDRAGNVEIAPATNDTWTIVDRTPPFIVSANALSSNSTPWIAFTFSEPMNRTSVEQAFSISPAVSGKFQWSADSRVMTFVPAGSLPAASYFVLVDTKGRDVAGNQLTQSKTVQFSIGSSGFALGDFWWILVLVGAAIAGALFLILRRRSAQATKPAPATPVTPTKGKEAIVEDVFLLYHKDGVLIKHETRRLRPDVDTDILSGMLTAVQAFVKDALRGDDLGELNEMTVGQMHIMIGRGKWLVLAARIEGDGSQAWTGQIERCIKDMEDHHWDQLDEWDGDMSISRVLAPYIKRLIQGGYSETPVLINA